MKDALWGYWIILGSLLGIAGFYYLMFRSPWILRVAYALEDIFEIVLGRKEGRTRDR